MAKKTTNKKNSNTAFLFLLIVLCGVVFSSCLSYSIVTSYIDYSMYKDFYISESNSLSSPHTPIGTIQVIITPGFRVDKYAVTNTGQKDKTKKYRGLYMSDAFARIYQEAKKTNANGIINLKWAILPPTNKSDKREKLLVTGMLVEIEKRQ